MANELAFSIVIGAALKSTFNAAIGNSITKFNKLGDTIGQVEKQSASITQFKKLRNGLAETSNELSKAKDRVAALTKSLKQSDGPNKKLSNELGAAKRQVGRLTEQLDKQRRTLNDHRLTMKQAGVDVRNLAQHEDKLGTSVDKLRSKYQRLGATLKAQQDIKQKRAEKRGELVDAAAIGYVLSRPISAAVEFESVMADVRKVVDFDTPEQFTQMGDDILEMSTRIPLAASGLGDIMAAAGQAGIARNELLPFTRDSARMGVAFDMSGEQAGSAMTGLRSIFKLNQSDVVLLGDAYNHLSNNMDATASDIINIANRTGSTAKIFGLTGEQVGALAASFLTLKTPPEVAATGINALLMRLATAEKQGDKFQGALESIGLSAAGLKTSIEQDAQGALMSFLTAVRGSDDVMGTLSDLFGMEYADDMAKLVGSLDIYSDALGNVANQTTYAGSMQAEYAARSATSANNLQLFRNRVARLGVTIGSVLLPPLNTIVGVVGSVVDVVALAATTFPTATKVVLGLVVGLAALKITTIAAGYAMTFVKGGALTMQAAYLGLSTVVTLVNTRLTLLNTTMLVTTARSKALAAGGVITQYASTLMNLGKKVIPVTVGALRTLAVALVTNPIGIAITAIASAGLLIYKYWQPLGAFFSGMWSGFVSALSPVFSALQPFFSLLSPLGSLLRWVGESIGSVVSWLGNLITPVTVTTESLSDLSSKGQAVGRLIGKAFEMALLPITKVGGAIGWVSDLWHKHFGDDEGQVNINDDVVPKPGDVAKSDKVIKVARTNNQPEAANQPVYQQLNPVVIPSLDAETQQINQTLNPVSIPQPGDTQQQVNQSLNAVQIGKPEAANQPVYQQLNPVVIPSPDAEIQQIYQQLNAANTALPADLTQQINQTLNPVSIPQPGDTQQQVNQSLNAVQIGKPEAANQPVYQQLNPVVIPSPDAEIQQIYQQLNAANTALPADLTQQINQTLNPVSIPQPGDTQQQVNQSLNAVQIGKPEAANQPVYQQLKPIKTDNIVEFPASLPVDVMPAFHGNAALQQQVQTGARTEIVNHNTYHITIQQQAGEDAAALTDRILREMERRQKISKRGAMYDE